MATLTAMKITKPKIDKLNRLNARLKKAHAKQADIRAMKASGQIRRATGTECGTVLHRENLKVPGSPCTHCGRDQRIMHVGEDDRVFCGDCCPGPECWPYGPERERAVAQMIASRRAA
jgi:hypothetical protein